MIAIVSKRRRPPNAAGTYGFFDVLRHPSRIVRPATPNEGQPDFEALRHGEARTVGCFLRGTVDPYPRRLRQGWLELSAEGATWKPFWGLRRAPLPIAVPIVSVTTRPADDREPLRVKKGG